MWFDTHCHLDAREFQNDLDQVVERATQHKVSGVLVPSVQASDFQKVAELSQRYAKELPYSCYTLGIHPMYTDLAQESDLDLLDQSIKKNLNNPRFVGVGEIGLDYFVEDLDPVKQEWFFDEQLKLAKKYDLPVILHVRKSQDQILKRLRLMKLSGGIAHAFNGSFVQAEEFLKLHFKLGVGGAMTYDKALQIRRLVKELPIESFVLETDAPDIPPSWLEVDVKTNKKRNEPHHISRIAKEFASIRYLDEIQVAKQILENTKIVLPRLEALITNSPAVISNTSHPISQS